MIRMKKLILSIAVLIGWMVWMTSMKPHNLVASWYDAPGGTMANGKIFDGEAYTCATRDWPLGTKLLITSGRRVIRVTVTDRINKRFAGKRIDLTPAAFEKLAPLDQGLVNVKVARR